VRIEPAALKAHRRQVRDRAVANDLDWLKWVLNWATKWQDDDGRYLMRENPARGYPIARERNPRRPVATQDRYEAIRKVSDQVSMELRRGVQRLQVRSYLTELLDLVNGTGRRISAILQLRYEDLRLELAPHGGIRWPADTDKMGKEWVTPIGAPVRAAIDRIRAVRPGVGRAYLFLSPFNPQRPISRDLASAWLEQAEQLAKVAKHEGSLWHAYRRKWASQRKHLPDRDVAAAGGWSDLTSLKTAYQQVDHATLVRVVTEPTELREAKA
jgi:integrase